MQRNLVRTVLLVSALAACTDRSTAPVMSDGATQARAACELTMSVAEARTLLGVMSAYVTTLEPGVLKASQARSLRSRLDRVASDLDAGRICQALNTVEGFKKQVDRLVADGDLTTELAAPLIEGALALLGTPWSGPPITFTSPTESSIVGTSGVILYTVGSTASLIECNLDGETVSCGPTSYEFAALAGGPHIFTIRAVTSLGVASIAALNFDVDAAAPTVTSLSAVETSPGTVRLSFTTADVSPIVRVHCRIDSGIFVLCGESASGAYDFPGLTVGEHLIEVVAFDIWGNSGNTSESSPPPASFARVTVMTTGLH